ncbi:MarR family winged helix-turn-helix transcriptional regulator [Frondihabitans cladoniiphilus]|uniref:MarR family winged helix-turn-helix transcriptional regulator n=1 Tax=Frondihabitans cladoniiphilus TaxID=715785 RepID=A0ABP8VMN1_9MICO
MSRRFLISDDVLADFAESAQQDLGRLLEAAARTVNETALARVVAGGFPDVRPSHIPVFAGLEPGGTRITVLAGKAGVSRQAMGAMVREVEALGYVVSQPDSNDARATLVALSDRGEKFCRAMITATNDLNDELTGRLGHISAQKLRRQLRVIAGGDGQ